MKGFSFRSSEDLSSFRGNTQNSNSAGTSNWMRPATHTSPLNRNFQSEVVGADDHPFESMAIPSEQDPRLDTLKVFLSQFGVLHNHPVASTLSAIPAGILYERLLRHNNSTDDASRNGTLHGVPYTSILREIRRAGLHSSDDEHFGHLGYDLRSRVSYLRVTFQPDDLVMLNLLLSRPAIPEDFTETVPFAQGISPFAVPVWASRSGGISRFMNPVPRKSAAPVRSAGDNFLANSASPTEYFASTGFNIYKEEARAINSAPAGILTARIRQNHDRRFGENAFSNPVPVGYTAEVVQDMNFPQLTVSTEQLHRPRGWSQPGNPHAQIYSELMQLLCAQVDAQIAKPILPTALDNIQRPFQPAYRLYDQPRPVNLGLLNQAINQGYVYNPNFQSGLSKFELENQKCPPHLNCALWIDHIMPYATANDILSQIYEGKVFVLWINTPQRERKLRAAAAKLIFFKREATEAFLLRAQEEGFFVCGRQARVIENRNRVWPRSYTSHSEEGQSRVLEIVGPWDKINARDVEAYLHTQVAFACVVPPVEWTTFEETHIFIHFAMVRGQSRLAMKALWEWFQARKIAARCRILYARDPCEQITYP